MSMTSGSWRNDSRQQVGPVIAALQYSEPEEDVIARSVCDAARAGSFDWCPQTRAIGQKQTLLMLYVAERLSDQA